MKQQLVKLLLYLGGAFIVALILGIILQSCEAPYQITETITKDSTGKEVRVITKKYNNGVTTIVPHASFNFVTHPGWDTFYGSSYYGGYYGMPYYNYYPRIVVPINPNIHYRQSNKGRH